MKNEIYKLIIALTLTSLPLFWIYSSIALTASLKWGALCE